MGRAARFEGTKIMANAKFAVGDTVELLPGSQDNNLRGGTFKIVRVMPLTNEGRQYRAKSTVETHERVLNETQLRQK
jgi:hypothetical protein